jgi:hypothetical protein
VSRLFVGDVWYACTEFELSGLVRERVWEAIDVYGAVQMLITAGLSDKEAADILASSERAAGFTSARQFASAVLLARSKP